MNITWHPPTNLPDAETNVLVGLNVDGIRTSCEGFISTDMHDQLCWYDVCAQPLSHEHVTGWCEMPEGPV